LLQDAISEAGFELLNPNALRGFEDDGKTHRSPLLLMDERAEMLRSADLLVGWMDQLQLKGFQLMLLRDIKTEVTTPLDPQTIQIMAAGLQALGLAQMRPKSGLVVPGRDDPRGVEITNCPRTITLSANQMGGLFGQLVSGPMNFPDPLVSCEVGQAVALGIPIIMVAISGPAVGLMATKANLLIPTFDDAPEALKTFQEHFDDEEARSAACTALMARFSAEAQKRKEEQLAALKKHMEEMKAAQTKEAQTEQPPPEKEKQGKLIQFPGN
jgi:hypothetical protein